MNQVLSRIGIALMATQGLACGMMVTAATGPLNAPAGKTGTGDAVQPSAHLDPIDHTTGEQHAGPDQ